MAVHEGAFMSLFMRHLGRQRVLPSQDSEDTQQEFSCARPHSIKIFYRLSTHDVTHEEMYPALSRFTDRKLGKGVGMRLVFTSARAAVVDLIITHLILWFAGSSLTSRYYS